MEYDVCAPTAQRLRLLAKALGCPSPMDKYADDPHASRCVACELSNIASELESKDELARFERDLKVQLEAPVRLRA